MQHVHLFYKLLEIILLLVRVCGNV